MRPMQVVTYGRSPFPGLNTKDVYAQVLHGGRMQRPPDEGGVFCPDAIWEHMNKCWSQRPEDRPTFQYLKVEFFDIHFFYIHFHIPNVRVYSYINLVFLNISVLCKLYICMYIFNRNTLTIIRSTAKATTPPSSHKCSPEALFSHQSSLIHSLLSLSPSLSHYRTFQLFFFLLPISLQFSFG